MKRLPLVALAVTLGTSIAAATTYSIDPVHSSVGFSIRHVVGKVTGHFDTFTGTFDYDEGKPQSWQTSASIEAASVNTGIEKRDHHLRTPDFFDVQKYPALSFKS